MGAEDLRKHVDERLEYIRKELMEISEGITEGPLKERVSNLTGEIEKLVYETLSEVPSTAEEKIKEELGITEHRSNQASYGGVPELFMTPDEQQMHKHTVSFGGIRQLFDVEMEVFGSNQPDDGPNGHESPEPSLSPSYEDVHRLFLDGPLQGTENFSGVSDMFKIPDEETHLNFGEKKKILGKEFDTTGRNHDRNVSIGGVRQLENLIDEDDDLFENARNEDGDNVTETPGGPEKSDSHNRQTSYGGARQLVTVECDTFSEEETKEPTPPQASNNDQEPDEKDSHGADGHERGVSVGGVRQLCVFEEDDLDFDGEPKEPQVDLEDDHSDAAEPTKRTPPAVEDPNPEDTNGMHDRNVSIGGVRTLQVYDLGLDDLDDNLGGKPRELFDGQGTVEDPLGHERRRSNLQDGRELFEDRNEEKVSTFDSSHPQGDSRTKMQDLKREHLQLKMSKIELIKSTAEEIDRLRGIIKTLASQLRHINEVHNKLLNATLGGQMLDSVFGAFTGFFSAPSEPSVQSNRN